MTAQAWWWLSFATEERHLGIALVKARDMTGAVLASHRNGCNPGGEVAGWDFPIHLGDPHPRWCNRLLSRHEAEQMSLEWTGERLVSMREHGVETPDVVEAEMNGGS